MSGMNGNVIGLYSVRDSIADQYGPVFQARTNGVAWRSYLEFLRRGGENPGFMAEDHKLYFLGLFDQLRGLLSPNTHPVLVEPTARMETPSEEKEKNGK